MKRKLAPTLLGLFLVVSAFSGQTVTDEVRSAMQGVSAEKLREHMAYLSSDELQGRGVGSLGYDLAAKYVQEQFQSLDLEPAAGAGSFDQVVRLRETDVVDATSFLAVVRNGQEIKLRRGADFLLGGDPIEETFDVDAPVVFTGYGIDAPELNHDDFRSIDLHKKIIAVFGGAPDSFPDDARNYYESPEIKWIDAQKRGAVGILFLVPEQTLPEPGHTMTWEVPGVAGNPLDMSHAFGMLGRSGIFALFQGESRSIGDLAAAVDKGQFASFELSSRVHMHVASRHQDLQSSNVVARLTGSDPSLKEEYVAVTAHLDHLGVGKPVDGDKIYHGALDNAAGVALMLEGARAFSKLAVKPKRSILFVAFTGEESGLLGSDFFVHYPPVPASQIVADVNLDSTTALYPLRDIAPLGAEHSTIDRDVRAAAAELKLEVSPDPLPEEDFFIRSDQFSFVLGGVPSVFVNEGVKTDDPKIDGMAMMKNWMATIYHTPRDNMSQHIVFESVVKQAQLNFLIAYLIAQDDKRPAWNPGDFFGEKFGRKN